MQKAYRTLTLSLNGSHSLPLCHSQQTASSDAFPDALCASTSGTSEGPLVSPCRSSEPGVSEELDLLLRPPRLDLELLDRLILQTESLLRPDLESSPASWDFDPRLLVARPGFAPLPRRPLMVAASIRKIPATMRIHPSFFGQKGAEVT